MITKFELNTSEISVLSFNILLHIVILFTILSIFFIKYISGVTSNIMNNEIKHIIHDGIKNSSNTINNTKKILYQNMIDQNKLFEEFSETKNDEDKLKIKDKLEKVTNAIDKLKNKLNKNSLFKYDYYIDLFSKENLFIII